jgi:hypothetical protein
MHRQSWEPNDPQAWIGFRCAADINATGQTGLTGDGLLPGQTAPTNTPDPATLGIIIPNSGGEEEGANAQPTLPPAPAGEQPPLGVPATATIGGTLDPG